DRSLGQDRVELLAGLDDDLDGPTALVLGAGRHDLAEGRQRGETGFPQLAQVAEQTLVTESFPGRRADLLSGGPSRLGEGEALPTVGLGADDEPFVFEQLEGRVDRAWAGPPDSAGPGGQLGDHLVSVH